MIRAIEHSRVTMTMEVASAPTVLHILELNNVKHVLFGTMDGRVGLLDIERSYFKLERTTTRKYKIAGLKNSING